MKVDILMTKVEGSVLAGTFTLEGENIVIESLDEYSDMMDRILMDEYEVEGEIYRVEEDPEGWLRSLPFIYHGIMMQAELTEDDGSTHDSAEAAHKAWMKRERAKPRKRARLKA